MHPIEIITDVQDRLATLFQSIPGSIPDTLEEEILALVNDVDQAYEQNQSAVVASIFFPAEVNYCEKHSVDCAIICGCIARAMEFDEEKRQLLMCAALTMNIGFIKLQNKLHNFSGQLPPEVKQAINRHPRQSWVLLKKAGIKQKDWLDTVLHHHERLDGTGYPQKTPGSELSESTRILILADLYGAIITPRGYRPAALSTELMRSFLVKYSNALDTKIVAYFMRCFGLYPPGVVVRLKSGQSSLVLAVGKSLQAPIVQQMTSGEPEGEPYTLNEERIDSVFVVSDDSSLKIFPQEFWSETAEDEEAEEAEEAEEVEE